MKKIAFLASAAVLAALSWSQPASAAQLRMVNGTDKPALFTVTYHTNFCKDDRGVHVAAKGTATLNVSSANGVASVVLMGLPTVTHGIDTTQRRLVLPITANAGGSVTVQVPSSNAAPAGHYYAIALDSRGVPSAAKIVQVAGSGGAAAAASVATTAGPEVARTAVDPEAPEGD